jgi:hypothetical protein
MPRDNITRVSIDLTTGQRAVVDQMLSAVGDETGFQPSVNQFVRVLLRQEAKRRGLEWPDDYPTPGGWRGGRKKKDGDEKEE